MNRALLLALCVLGVLHLTSAMYGLCSTNWFTDDQCYDFGDECADMGGGCYHPGHVGDHGEGCICLRREMHRGVDQVVILTKDHFNMHRWDVLPPRRP